MIGQRHALGQLIVHDEMATLRQSVVRGSGGAVEARYEPEYPVVRAATDRDRSGIFAALGEFRHGCDVVCAHCVGLRIFHVIEITVAWWQAGSAISALVP